MIESIFFNPWIWIVPVILIICVALIVLDIIADLYGIGAILGGLAFLILGGVYFGAILPPYDVSFYQTYRITGEVGQIESAFSGDEGTMSQVFIAKVDGVDLFIKSDDQRFRTISVGDDVNLVCAKGFAYFQEPWFDCSFGGNR
jgi:hypothetical protein